MRCLKILFALVFIAFPSIIGYTETDVQEGTRIAKMYDDMPSFGKVRATINLRIYDREGNVRFVKKLIMASHTENPGSPNKIEKFIAYFQLPADDMGSSVLFTHYANKPDEKYFYLKSIRKVKKLVGGDNKLSFFGSDYANSEVSMPKFRDFTYRYLGDAMVPFKGKEIECYLVEALPKSPEVIYDLGYGKKLLYFEKKSLLSMKSIYFDEKMVKWKETELLSFITKNNEDGKKVYYTTGTEMRNLKTGTKSRISFSDFLFEQDAGIDRDIFTLEYLTRKWW